MPDLGSRSTLMGHCTHLEETCAPRLYSLCYRPCFRGEGETERGRDSVGTGTMLRIYMYIHTHKTLDAHQRENREKHTPFPQCTGTQGFHGMNWGEVNLHG